MPRLHYRNFLEQTTKDNRKFDRVENINKQLTSYKINSLIENLDYSDGSSISPGSPISSRNKGWIQSPRFCDQFTRPFSHSHLPKL